MFVQAWGHYGTVWPVVHQQLGVRPDMGRESLEVVPQVPSTAPIAGRDIRLGKGELDLVAASRDGNRYRTTVDTGSANVKRLLIGHTLPRGASVRSVTLDGRRADWDARRTNRGLEVTVEARKGEHTLVVESRAERQCGTAGPGRPSHSFSSAHRAPTVHAWTRLDSAIGSTSPTSFTAYSSGARPSRSSAARTPARTRSASSARPAARRPPQPSHESNGHTEPRW